jgi:hypothetical protein
MKVIEIPKTEKTPEIILDDDQRILQIKGNCLPENIRDFSEVVLEKLRHYLEGLAAETTANADTFRVYFRLGYFNTAAAKFIADVLALTGSYIKKGYPVRIYWYFEENDNDMLEAGEEIARMINVPMEYIMVVKHE